MWSDAARAASLQSRGGAAGGGSLGSASAAQAQMGQQGAAAISRAQAAAGGRGRGGRGGGGRGGGGSLGGVQNVKIVGERPAHQQGVNAVPKHYGGVMPDAAEIARNTQLNYRNTVAPNANARDSSPIDKWVPERFW